MSRALTTYRTGLLVSSLSLVETASEPLVGLI